MKTSSLITYLFFITFNSITMHAKQVETDNSYTFKDCIIVNEESTISKNNDLEKIKSWQAGEIVNKESILVYGKKNCFCQNSIDSKLFQRIYKKSYKENCTVPLKDLRYLKVLHVDLKSQIHLGELICHKDISQDLLDIFEALFDANYPIERMVLIDNYNAEDELSMRDNNTSCFNFRMISGTHTPSNHSTGRAIDINPLYNPYVRMKGGKTIYQPKTAKAYLNRKNHVPYMIKKGDLCYKLFKRHGFIWGGDWKSVKDFQHFEKKQVSTSNNFKE